MRAPALRKAVAIVAALALVTCGGAPAATSPTPTTAASSAAATAAATTGQPYTVGFQGGLTGSVAATPVSALDGMKAYFAELNKKGGVNGHPVNLVARDDTGQDTAKAITNFIEFRDSLKVPVIAGWSVSNVTDAVIPQATDAKIPLLIMTGTEATLAHPYAYLVDTLFSQDAIAEVNFLKTLLKPGEKPKIAVFAATSAAGRTMESTLKKEITANGWDLVIDEAISIAPIPPDMVPQANAVVAAKADYVMGGIFLSLPVSFMRTLAQQNWQGKVINFRGGSGPTIMQQVNQPNYYALRSYAYPTDAAAKKVFDAVKANGGNINGDNVAGGWATADLIAKTLAKCGFPCTGEQFKKALDGLGQIPNPDGSLMGAAGFTQSDHCMIKFERFYNWVNGAPAPAGQSVPVSCPVQTPAG